MKCFYRVDCDDDKGAWIKGQVTSGGTAVEFLRRDREGIIHDQTTLRNPEIHFHAYDKITVTGFVPYPPDGEYYHLTRVEVCFRKPKSKQS